MKIIAEPGRFISSVAFTYVANVIAKHKKVKTDLIYYLLDDGIHGNMGYCHLFGRFIECIPLNPGNDKKYRSILGGQTCDSHHIICDFQLEELEIGDLEKFYFFWRL